MSNTTIAELGDDTDLLLFPDQWLENHRIDLQSRMAELADQLNAVLIAQRFKSYLQQKNMVAICCLNRTATGTPISIIIEIMPLPDAVVILDNDKQDPTAMGKVNAEQQERTWVADGYDVSGARRLKRYKS